MTDKLIKVVGAAIVRDGHILTVERSETMTLPNLWEFPGGKIEPGETKKEALTREIQEELGLTIVVDEFINTARFQYDFGIVELSVFTVRIKAGELRLTEHSQYKWLKPTELNTLTWAPVDIEAVNILSQKSV
ncbi:(deoxy)nucleoside triphosphate pyrophosphohydrolase [Dolosigranulum pigrum]|jgi:hypothetical protein|uniref:(deoxy)nucleoside triphosphate pyrophosphohydrolase n=1 Tax=Dolosigranulum pigrum TaxID=29394 RepID=UPI000DC4631A|nr:(deoxy)nucleoside triphosphate pyrophosphohydrolase [Dolosigranulum pigrum]QJS97309.1 (deoxy)nucleoside triphosphate pyrophosphohydrolase [Dolosigranulum pigrum]